MMNIVMKSTVDLIPYKNNPRQNEKAVQYVAESIRQFGFKVPIVIDTNNVIVAGHTRLKAAEELGIDLVPCLIADDLTEEQVKAYRLVDNKTSEFASWDMAALQEELEAIELNMSDFGFIDVSEIDIDGFFEDSEPKEKEEKEIQCPHCKMFFKV